MVSHPIYVVLGAQPATSHMLNEHYIIWATNSAFLPITNLLRKKSGKINHIHNSFQKERKKGKHNPTQHHHAGRRRFSWLGTRPPLSPMPRGRVPCPQNTWWGHLQGPPDEQLLKDYGLLDDRKGWAGMASAGSMVRCFRNSGHDLTKQCL